MAGPVRRVVIVGGGTSGWMAAAAFSRFLDDGERRIVLVESEEIGTIGVGEATIPPIREFNQRIGVDEAEFIAATGASFKLGIEFRGWGTADSAYLHPFGEPGQDFEGIAFHQFWLKHRQGALEDYFLTAALARANRFAPPAAAAPAPIRNLAYAYHFDAGLYAGFLRRLAESRGVERVEGRITRVRQDPETGHVSAVALDGREIAGDLFVDCSGFRSLLLGEAMGAGFEDWSHWLPCDRAIAVATARTDPVLPYTRSTAHAAGWQWRIPLQHRTGNGVVYPSAFLGDDEAERLLLANVDAPPQADPRAIRIRTGVRQDWWRGNVVAIGLAGGFIEPLESTAIHLVQAGITRLFWLFPDREFSPVLAAEYNRAMREQYEFIRDFIVLHYHCNRRPEPFWRAMADMAVPHSLEEKLALWREGGRLRPHAHDLFAPASWVAVLLGQGVDPQGHDPLADTLDPAKVTAAMAQIARSWQAIAQAAPDHGDVLRGIAGGRVSRA